jgi:hypothetical protein
MSDSGQMLYEKQQVKVAEMYKAIDCMYRAGKSKAAYGRKYRISLRRAIAKLRDEGTPVAIVTSMAKGIDEIAKLEEAAEVAAVQYDFYRELINANKSEANLLEGQIRREWSK